METQWVREDILGIAAMSSATVANKASLRMWWHVEFHVNKRSMVCVRIQNSGLTTGDFPCAR
jgi:hypothetical protein